MERPILFSSEMVRAILDDKKTETRRVVKPKPLSKITSFAPYSTGKAHPLAGFWQSNGCWNSTPPCCCPYGVPGDILYVRETFHVIIDPSRDFVWYRADCDEIKCNAYKWKPNIHMPKKYSRIKLKIVEIRIERIQDITVLDAINEGSFSVDTELVRPGYFKQAKLAESKG